MWVMSTAARISTQRLSPARLRIGAPAPSGAARTGRSCSVTRGRASADLMAGTIRRSRFGFDPIRSREGSVPGVGDLFEHFVAELFRRARDGAAPQRPVELHRRLVVGQ